MNIHVLQIHQHQFALFHYILYCGPWVQMFALYVIRFPSWMRKFAPALPYFPPDSREPQCHIRHIENPPSLRKLQRSVGSACPREPV